MDTSQKDGTMMRTPFKCFFILSLFLFPSCLSAVILHMTDGMEREAEILEEQQEHYVIKTKGMILTIRKDLVREIVYPEVIAEPDFDLQRKQWNDEAAHRAQSTSILLKAFEYADKMQPTQAIDLLLEALATHPNDPRIPRALLSMAEFNDARIDPVALSNRVVWTSPWFEIADIYFQAVTETANDYREGLLGQSRKGVPLDQLAANYCSFIDFSTMQPYPVELLRILGSDPKRPSEKYYVQLQFLVPLLQEVEQRADSRMRAILEKQRDQLLKTAAHHFYVDLFAYPERYFDQFSGHLRDALLARSEEQLVARDFAGGLSTYRLLIPFGLDAPGKLDDFITLKSSSELERGELILGLVERNILLDEAQSKGGDFPKDLSVNLQLLALLAPHHPSAFQLAAHLPEVMIQRYEMNLLTGTSPRLLLPQFRQMRTMLASSFTSIPQAASVDDFETRLVKESEAEAYLARIEESLRDPTIPSLQKAEAALQYFKQTWPDTIATEIADRKNLGARIVEQATLIEQRMKLVEEKRQRFVTVSAKRAHFVQQARVKTEEYLQKKKYKYPVDSYWNGGKETGYRFDDLLSYEILTFDEEKAFVVNEETLTLRVITAAVVREVLPGGIRIVVTVAWVWEVDIDTEEILVIGTEYVQ